jgi:hypothetical protein
VARQNHNKPTMLRDYLAKHYDSRTCYNPFLRFDWIEEHFYTSSLVVKGYDLAREEPYAVPHRDRFLILVSSPKHIEELAVESTRKLSKLSAQGIMVDVSFNTTIIQSYGTIITKQTLNPEFTINALRDDPKGFIAPNLLKHKIRTSLPDMYQLMQETVEDAFRNEAKGQHMVDGNLDTCLSFPSSWDADISAGWSRICLCNVANRITARMNNILLVGGSLGKQLTQLDEGMLNNDSKRLLLF